MFGLDVRAKVAAAKSVIEQRAEEVAQYAGQTVQTAAVIAALSALPGVLGAMAVSVGLYALYRVDADIYGVYAGLGVLGGVLVVAVLILFLIVRAKGQSLSGRRIFRPLRPIPVTASSSAPVVATADGHRFPTMRRVRSIPKRPGICLSLWRSCCQNISNIPPWGIQCSMNSWRTWEPQRAKPPMRRWKGQRTLCATAIDNSSSPC